MIEPSLLALLWCLAYGFAVPDPAKDLTFNNHIKFESPRVCSNASLSAPMPERERERERERETFLSQMMSVSALLPAHPLVVPEEHVRRVSVSSMAKMGGRSAAGKKTVKEHMR